MATRKPTIERRDPDKPLEVTPATEVKSKPRAPRRRKTDPPEPKPGISVDDLENVVSILSEFKKPKQTENEAKIELEKTRLHAWLIKTMTIAATLLLSAVAAIIGYATVMEIEVALPDSVTLMLTASKEILMTILKASE